MKAFSPSATHKQRTMRRVSKPLMEKRRRERINHSLEALRLLMLENTNDEKMMNPKVEKAEILESVVQFLKAEKGLDEGPGAMKRGLPGEQRQPRAHQRSYTEGMRSCLLQVSRFIASRSQEPGNADGGSAQASPAPPLPPVYPSPSGHMHRALMPAAAGDSAALTPQHPLTVPHPCFVPGTGLPCDSGRLLSPTAAPSHVTDPVWRPWPQ